MGKKRRHAPVELEPVQAPVIDSHCHLAAHVYGDETERVVQRALGSGIERVVNIGGGYGLEGNEQVLEMYRWNSRLHPTIGVHPHDASILAGSTSLFDRLLELARRVEVVAVGEIGLDYHYDFSPRTVQRASFQKQLEIARIVGKPVIVHDREAHQDVLSILDEHRAWDVGVVFHCFSGDWALADVCLSRGAFLGISGVVTFKKAEALQEVAARAPLERLLVETDSPYLAPAPYRGKCNEPVYVHLVTREIARLRSLEAEQVAASTSRSAREIFCLPAT